jgi:BMFP domain-containing protein YqiC
MQATPFIDELTAKLSQLAATSPARDVEKNLRALLSAGLARLDVVTREEFDGRQAARAHAREARCPRVAARRVGGDAAAPTQR